MKRENLSKDTKLLFTILQSLLASCGFALEDAINDAKREADLVLVCGDIMGKTTAKIDRIVKEDLPDCLMMYKRMKGE